MGSKKMGVSSIRFTMRKKRRVNDESRLEMRRLEDELLKTI